GLRRSEARANHRPQPVAAGSLIASPLTPGLEKSFPSFDRLRFSMAGDLSLFDDLPPERRPEHIAIIMDGNGRWAQRQGLVRVAGHERGAMVVREMTELCSNLGIKQLTLYCLSSENWKRPADEIAFLMYLLQQYIIG